MVDTCLCKLGPEKYYTEIPINILSKRLETVKKEQIILNRICTGSANDIMLHPKRAIFMILPLLFVPLVYGMSSTPDACAVPPDPNYILQREVGES